jgi:hypothetical protein
MNPMEAAAAKKQQERETLRNVIAQWNANRLDLFELSEPNEVSLDETRNKVIICAFEHRYCSPVRALSADQELVTSSELEQILRGHKLNIWNELLQKI